MTMSPVYSRPIYRFYLDWFDDGFNAPFSEATESGIYEDIQFAWGSDHYGGAFNEVAPGRGSIALRNLDGLFNAENQDSPLSYRVGGVNRTQANLRHRFLAVRDDLPGGRQVVFACHVYPPVEEINPADDIVNFELAHEALYQLREFISPESGSTSTLQAELVKMGAAPVAHVASIAANRPVPPYDFGRITRKVFIDNLVLMTACDAYMTNVGEIVFQPLDTGRSPIAIGNVDLLDLRYDSRVVEPLTDVTFETRSIITGNWTEVGSGERSPLFNQRRWGAGDATFTGDALNVPINPAETYA